MSGLEYGAILQQINGTFPISATMDASGIIQIISFIAWIIAIWYVNSEGELPSYGIHLLIGAGFLILGVILGFIVGLPLFFVIGMLATFIIMIVAIIPVWYYYSRLLDSWLMGLAWVLADLVSSIIGLSPLVHAYIFVNWADGDYW